MKKFVAALPIVALLLSCSHSNVVEDGPSEGEATVTFAVANYMQYSMDDELTDGPVQTQRNVRRASASGVSALAHLALGVFDEDGKLYLQQLQDAGSDGYGAFSLTLPYGHYTLVFLGYSGSHTVQLDSPTAISFEGGYVPNCFCKTLALDVDANSGASQSITMSRCVGCFTVRCSEGIPADMAALEYTAEDGGVMLNAMTGLAANVTSRSGSIDFSQTVNRQNAQTATIYAFLPSQECEMNFTCKAVRADGSVLRSRSFGHVPMMINQRTLYNGDFFAEDPTSAGAAFTLTLDDVEWKQVEYTY